MKWLNQNGYLEKLLKKKINNPKSLKQTDNINLDGKQLKEELAKKMINPYYFTYRVLQFGFNITLESHHINHANCKIIFKPKYPEFWIEVRYNNKIIKKYLFVMLD